MDQELTGKVAFVSGGGRGIGKAAVLALAKAGASVVIGGRKREQGEAVVREVEAQGGKAIFTTLEVRSNADWARAMAETQTAFGRLDILVLNAGITDFAPIGDMPLEQFRNLNEINLKGTYFGLQHGVEAMRKHGQGGSIILMSSIVGLIGIPATAHYSASKGGLRLLAKAAALELGPEKIRVNSLHPGMVHTDMTEAFNEDDFKAIIPLQRFGKAEEIADVILFAASDRSKFMTGTELIADGGHSTR